MRFFVFRINYDEAYDWILNELFDKYTLRQGWGLKGMELKSKNGAVLGKEDWISNYQDSASKYWKSEESYEKASGRYNILSRMLDIEKESVVVIPKIPDSQTFAICKVEEQYSFDFESETKWSDFRHCIKVSNIRKYGYLSSSESRIISSKFIAYQSAINNVWNSNFHDKCLKLYARDSEIAERTISGLWTQIIEKSIKDTQADMLDMNPNDFEDIIAECLKARGYEVIAKRKYDGEGADVDIMASFKLPYFHEKIDEHPTIYLQIKKKKGNDYSDIEGVRQLIKATTETNSAIKILMNTTTKLSEDAIKLANANGVKIIHGEEVIRFILTSNLRG